MLSLSGTMIGSEQPEVLADFYEKIIGASAQAMGDGWYSWEVGKAWLTIGPHSEVHGQSQEPPRIMHVYECGNVEGEFNRMKDVDGATVIAEPYDMQGGMIATLSDPDGNYFQLMTPWEEQ